MKAAKIKGYTGVLGAPVQWDPDENGYCDPLPVLMGRMETATGHAYVIQSAWLPSPKELAALNAGHSVIVTIWGTQQPPVALGVSEAPQE